MYKRQIQGALSDLLSAGQHDKIQISRTALCELLDERKVSEDRVVNTIGLENKKEQRFPACDRFCFTRERTEPYIPLSNLVSRALLLEIAGEVK